MAGIYVFDQSMEKDFVDPVIRKLLPKEFNFGIKSDGSYKLNSNQVLHLNSSVNLVDIERMNLT